MITIGQYHLLSYKRKAGIVNVCELSTFFGLKYLVMNLFIF